MAQFRDYDKLLDAARAMGEEHYGTDADLTDAEVLEAVSERAGIALTSRWPIPGHRLGDTARGELVLLYRRGKNYMPRAFG